MAVCLLPVIAFMVVLDRIGKEFPRWRREIQVELGHGLVLV